MAMYDWNGNGNRNDTTDNFIEYQSQKRKQKAYLSFSVRTNSFSEKSESITTCGLLTTAEVCVLQL